MNLRSLILFLIHWVSVTVVQSLGQITGSLNLSHTGHRILLADWCMPGVNIFQSSLQKDIQIWFNSTGEERYSLGGLFRSSANHIVRLLWIYLSSPFLSCYLLFFSQLDIKRGLEASTTHSVRVLHFFFSYYLVVCSSVSQHPLIIECNMDIAHRSPSCSGKIAFFEKKRIPCL